MGVFAAVGDGLGSLAKGLASSQVTTAKQLASVVGSNWQQWQHAMGTNAGALASMFSQGADALAAAAVGGIDRLSDVAGQLDSRGEAVHAVSLLSGQGPGDLSRQCWQLGQGWGARRGAACVVARLAVVACGLFEPFKGQQAKHG